MHKAAEEHNDEEDDDNGAIENKLFGPPFEQEKDEKEADETEEGAGETGLSVI